MEFPDLKYVLVLPVLYQGYNCTQLLTPWITASTFVNRRRNIGEGRSS